MKKPRSKNLAHLTVLLSLLLATISPGGATTAKPLRTQPLNTAGAVTSLALTPAQIEAGVEEYFASIGSLDVQRYANNFAPDGVLEDPVGTPPVQGKPAIGVYFAGIIAPFSEIKPKVEEVIVCGNEAIVNWKLKLKTTTGKHITIDGMGIFKFNLAGKLQSVREFWDLQDFLEQLQS